ncbi:hypothetical protein MRX96_013011 [Rhipicephalus microplus]
MSFERTSICDHTLRSRTKRQLVTATDERSQGRDGIAWLRNVYSDSHTSTDTPRLSFLLSQSTTAYTRMPGPPAQRVAYWSGAGLRYGRVGGTRGPLGNAAQLRSRASTRPTDLAALRDAISVQSVVASGGVGVSECIVLKRVA